MKLVHTADIHIGMENYGRLDPETGLSTRLADFLRAFDRMVDFAINEKVDLFLFAGDAYKHREPTPTHQREFSRRILRMTKAGIPCVLLVGNHDTPNALGKATSLDIYSALEQPLVHVIREPSVVEVNGLQVVGIPWLSGNEFANLEGVMKNLFKELDPAKPAVITAHASVAGAQYGSEKLVSLEESMSIPLEWFLHPTIAYVALGHIHQRQIVNNDPPVVYAGSIERVDFGELKEEKSFELVEINPNDNKFMATHRRIPTGARQFIHIECSVPDGIDATALVLRAISKKGVEDAVVKITVNFGRGAADLDVNAIREALRGAFFVAGIAKNIARVDRNQTQLENVEGLTIQQALEKYFSSKLFTPAKIGLLQRHAQKLMKES